MKLCCNHADCSGPPRNLEEEARRALRGKGLADSLLKDSSISDELHSRVIQLLRDSLQ